MAEIWIYTTPQNRLHVANAFALNAIHAQNTLNLFSHVLDSENLLFFCLIYNNHCVAMFISSAEKCNGFEASSKSQPLQPHLLHSGRNKTAPQNCNIVSKFTIKFLTPGEGAN